jgi:hypothetical protein
MRVKEPLEINYEGKVEDIMAQIMDAIEQTEDFDTLANLKEAKA